jgi:hypothetical protein
MTTFLQLVAWLIDKALHGGYKPPPTPPAP